VTSGTFSYPWGVEYLFAILPSVGVLALFILAVRALVQADRRERAAQARWEALSPTPDVPAAPAVEPPRNGR
jgi:hypothetical protein